MNKKVKILLKIINYLLVATVVVFSMLMVGVKIFGIQIYAVLSGSMTPTYKVGSLIYVVDVNTDELKVGDAITFKMSDKVTATHRITEIIEETSGKKFRTKGDANDFIDEGFIESKNIIGKPIFTIPYLGYVTSFMQTTAGNLITIGMSILLITIVIFLDTIIDDKKEGIKV